MSNSRNAQEALDKLLVEAAKSGNVKDIEAAIGPEVARLKPSQAALDKALGYAYRCDHLDAMECLIANGANPDVTFPNIINRNISATLLQHATYYQQTDKVKLLLRFAKNIDAVSSEGKTALHYAIEENNGSIEICELLLGKGASENYKVKDHRGNVPSSQIGMILKLGRIEIAKLLLARRPRALEDFQQTHPNIISYICASPVADHDAREAMICYLLCDVPSLTVTADDIKEMHEKNQHAELLPLCIERMQLNQFWLVCQKNMGGKIKKQLSDALDAYYKEGNPFNNQPNAVLASDIMLIMQNQHPIITNKRFMQIFHDFLALFITPPNGKLCRNMTFMLYGACEYLLNSRHRYTAETKMLCQLTLLTALHTISNSSEDTYRVIVKLMQAMIPERQEFESSKYGETLLRHFIDAYPSEVKALVKELKQFYTYVLGIKLTAIQVNPCSAIEKLLDEYFILQYKDDAHLYHQSALHAEAEIDEVKQDNYQLHDHIVTLKAEIAFIRAEKDQIADSFTDAHKWKMKAQQINHDLQYAAEVLREENEALKKMNQELMERVQRQSSDMMAARIIETAKARAAAEPDSASASPVKLKQKRARPNAKPVQEKKPSTKSRAKRVARPEDELESPDIPAPIESGEFIPAKPTIYPPKKIKQSPAASPDAPNANMGEAQQQVPILTIRRVKKANLGLFDTSKDKPTGGQPPQKRR